ncbi:MAG TPA: hypothetical protein VFE47_01130 [Tepidisphaeraceae bacterium]|jgi:hypothetical protein|nr:hypothetical protein [Tepidisphaeraceae bacterium]
MIRERNTAVARPYQNGAVIHVRFAGRSFDISMIGLDLMPASTDRQVKREIAGYLQVADERLDDYVVDRHPNGNLTIRPEAVFG